MRMKFNKTSQLLLVVAASLLAAGFITACGTLTTDFVYVASSKAAGPNQYGEIDVFEINQESGRMRPIPASPFPSGGRYPIAEAVSTDFANLYVVNQDDNNIVQFLIGNDGKLYPQNTVNTPGIFPLALAVTSSYAYVADTYQPLPGCSPAAPCSGSVAVFPVSASSGSKNPGGVLGSPVTHGSLNYWPLALTGANAGDIITPTGVSTLTSGGNTYVYVTAYDATTSPYIGYVFGFVSSGGVLTPLAGSPYRAGAQPSAVATASGTVAGGNSYVYVTDEVGNNVLAFSANAGVLTPLSGSPYKAGGQPVAIVADPAFPYLYVANSTDSTVTAYSMSNGALANLGTYSVGVQPVAIGIDPSTNHFLYTANFLGNNVSAFELNETSGTLLNTQGTPFSSNANPSAVAAIPHGAPKK